MKHSSISLLLLASAWLLFAGCAKEGFPSGGPKDETPPKVLGTTPASGTLQFAEKSFAIAFDEYVQVRDADKNILVSPPMKQKPEYTTKGRSVVVKINDTLLPNTTYLFQFREAIVDFNEGNPLGSYEYVFSTGAQIDSMTIRGRVTEAFTDAPHADAVTVLAYAQASLDSSARTCADSIVAKQKPKYMTRCDKEGNFQLNHMASGQYLVLALLDADNNLMLNSGEAVAFLDTLVTPQRMPRPIVADTSHADSTALDSTTNTSTALDSTTNTSTTNISTIQLRLSLLTQVVQRVVKSEFERKGKCTIATAAPLSPSYRLRPLDSLDTAALYIVENRTRDTLTLYTQSASCDSLVLLLTDTNLADTLRLKFRPKAQGRSMGGKSPMLSSLVRNNHPYYDTLRIAFGNPVVAIDSAADSMVAVFNLTDSTLAHCTMQLIQPCQQGHAYMGAMIAYAGKAGQKYRFTIQPGHFTDIYGNANPDSLVISTQYDKAENYGNIHLTLDPDSLVAPLLLQLCNEKGETLRQSTLLHGQMVPFDHLKGGKYRLRAVLDLDANGQWTPADYWQCRQPEPVLYYDKTLELRENWDMEETWKLRVTRYALSSSSLNE